MNYYGTDPARYAMHQQSRQDQRMSNLLNMMMQMQAMKQRRSMWEQEQALQKEQLASIDRYRRAQEKEWAKPPAPPTPSSTMKTIEEMVAAGIAPNRKIAFDMYKGLKDPERIKLEAQMRKEGEEAGKSPTEQTAFDRKKTALQKRVASGEITQQQMDQALLGIKPPQTEGEKIRKGYATRDKNLAFASKAHSQISISDMKKQVKGVPGAVPTVDGVRVDMPTQYGAAMMNVEDRVATPEDEYIIRKYDTMFQAFMDNVLPNFKKFKDFRDDKGRGKDWDLKQVKRWFDIYK